MIALLRVLVVIIPATIWYGAKIMWLARRRSPRLACLCEEIQRKWSRMVLRAAGVRVVIENPEVIDPDRPQILVANHTSWFDVPALAGHLPGPYRFVAKQELARVPFFGPAWRSCGHIGIDRKDRAKAIESLAVAKRRLEEERPTVILFAEGTRSRDGRLQPFKKGAFVLAIQTGVEIVPAAIIGARDVMKKGSLLIHPGTIRIRFGEPVPVERLTMEDRNDLARRTREAVAALLESASLPEETIE
ncbi:MAG: lysophospholipid acyltransferase family protein [Gemmatimonadota bacterium]